MLIRKLKDGETITFRHADETLLFIRIMESRSGNVRLAIDAKSKIIFGSTPVKGQSHEQIK
ncbi:MAG: hypothetical protein JXA82_17900 [Sedimentisphaerales bacterium]|nr:hypothetical protein [Sedimentisphaerales bacterium]